MIVEQVYAKNIYNLLTSFEGEKSNVINSLCCLDAGLMPERKVNITMSDTAEDVTNIFEAHIKVETIDNLNKNIVLNILSNYNPKEFYGIIVKHNDKFMNPMNPFKTIEFYEYISTIDDSDFSFTIALFKFKDGFIPSDSYDKEIEKQKDEVKNIYSIFMNNKTNVNISAKIKVHYNTSIGDDMVESIPNIKKVVFNEMSQKFVDFNNDIRIVEETSLDSFDRNKEIMVPVSLATHYISYPYYGVLAIKSNERGEFARNLIGRNVSENFKSGNIGYHVNKVAALYNKTTDERICYILHDTELILEIMDIDKEEFPDAYNSLLYEIVENCCEVNCLRREISDFYEIVIEDFNDRQGYSACYVNDILYSTKVCLGERGNGILDLNVLENMNIQSMFYNYTLSSGWATEAIANQLLAKEILSIIHNSFETVKTEINKSLNNQQPAIS